MTTKTSAAEKANGQHAQRRHDPPATLKGLYAELTGDTASHQRRVDGHFRKLDKRQQRIIRARIDGRTLAEIGEAHGITAGSAHSVIRKALESIRKKIAGEPRYNRIGHGSQPQASA